MNDAGFLVLCIPALFLLIALDTSVKASSCPITLCLNPSSRFLSLYFSVSVILLTGIFVHFSITFAISSSFILIGFAFSSNSSILSLIASSFCLNSAIFSKSVSLAFCTYSSFCFNTSSNSVLAFSK